MNKILELLETEFTCGVSQEDIKDIMYRTRVRKGKVVSIVMEDCDCALGHMYVHLTTDSSTLEYAGVSLDEVTKYLVDHGALNMKRKKRVQLSSYYD